MIEHPVFFNNKIGSRPYAKLNRIRCAYHRASTEIWVQSQSSKIEIDYVKFGFDFKSLHKYFISKSNVFMFDPIDNDLVSQVKSLLRKIKCPLTILESPLFLLKTPELDDYIKMKGGKLGKILNHASFYSWMRRNTGYLMTKDGKTVGGKMSWDTSNRKSIPKSVSIPKPFAKRQTQSHSIICENAWKWANETFPDHYGPPPSTSYKTVFKYLAIDHKSAHKLLDYFIRHKLSKFGSYQDAIMNIEGRDETIHMFHSNVSHVLNNGLISPKVVIERVLHWFEKSDQSEACLAQAEGFIRQVLGWREYARLVAVKYRPQFWKANGLKQRKRLTAAWYNGTTGSVPVDSVIKKAFDTAYLHHIERLMIMGNYMTLNQIHPRDMYQWFMEFAIDSYDWIMIVNVFGMAAHADMGDSMTKPYVSSSNYVLKMSHYKRGDWSDNWDALYYAFLHRHEKVFSKNPRMGLMMRGLKLKKQNEKEWLRLLTLLP